MLVLSLFLTSVSRYTLPDGRVITMGRERFEAPEALFTPSLVDEETPGMAELLFKTIQSADIDLRAEFYKHIVLSGGSSMYPGLPSRLEKDIKSLYLRDVLKGNAEGLKKFQIRIEDPPRRKHMVFLGGAVLADIMRDKEEFWMTRKEYNEIGELSIEMCFDLVASHVCSFIRQGCVEEARIMIKNEDTRRFPCSFVEGKERGRCSRWKPCLCECGPVASCEVRPLLLRVPARWAKREGGQLAAWRDMLPPHGAVCPSPCRSAVPSFFFSLGCAPSLTVWPGGGVWLRASGSG